MNIIRVGSVVGGDCIVIMLCESFLNVNIIVMVFDIDRSSDRSVGVGLLFV